MTTTQTNLAAHETCHLTGIDCPVPHCRSCDGKGYFCDGDCGGTGQARCECGELAVAYVVHSIRGREAVCAACPADPDYDGGDGTVRCDGCGIVMLPTEVVSPKEWGKEFCCLCLSAVPEAEPAPADPGRTLRIPVQTMSALVEQRLR